MDEIEEVEFDWTSAYAISHVSFILSQSAPLTRCTGSQVTQVQNQVSTQIGNRHRDGTNIFLSGGIFDGYMIPIYQKKNKTVQSIALQYDIVAVLEDTIAVKSTADVTKKGAVVIVDKKNIGFINVTLQPFSKPKFPEQCQVEVDGKMYLSSTAMQSHIKQRLSFNNKDISRNILVALQLPSWPEASLKWKSRNRRSNWPYSTLIEDVSEQPCLLVPEHHPQSISRHLEWQYSFILPEQRLFEHLNPIQKQCMVLFRILRDQNMSFPSILTDYHLKTVFMWVCEKIPPEEWTYQNMGTYFIHLIDFLMECVIYQNLPHYFMPEWNLLEGLSDIFQEHLLKILGEIRSNPLQPFYNFMSESTLYYLPDKKNFQDLFDVIEKDKAQDEYRSILTKHKAFVHKMSKKLLEERKFDVALQVLDLHKLSNFYVPLLELASPANYLSNIASEIDPETAAEVFKYFYSGDVEPNYLGDMACMQHIQSVTATDETIKAELETKAKETFQQALSHKDASNETKMDYCHFLYSINDYSTALPLLDEIIEAESKADAHYCSNYCSEMGSSTMDGNLQQEIQALGTKVDISEFCVFSYAYYIKVKILHSRKQYDDVEKTLTLYKQSCEVSERSPRNPSVQGICWNIYGYAAKDAGKLQEAKEGFKRALRCNPRLPLAQMNIDLCDAMALSLETSNGQSKATDTKHIYLPQEIRTIRTLHSVHITCKDPKQKVNLKETINSMCRALLHAPYLKVLTGVDFAYILLQQCKPDEALSILDDVFEQNNMESLADLQFTCYTQEDVHMVDECIKPDILKLGGEDQHTLPVLAYSFYLAVQALIQLERYKEVTDILQKFEAVCIKIEKEETGPLTKQTFRQLYKYAEQNAHAKPPKENTMEKIASPEQMKLGVKSLNDDKLKFQIQPEATADKPRDNSIIALEDLKQLPLSVQLRLMHLCYVQSDMEQERSMLRKRIGALYERHWSMLEVQMDYANFLYQTKQFRDAIQIVNEILKQANNDYMTPFTKDEMNIVDINILSEIVNYDGNALPLPVLGYAFYMKVQCLYKLDEQRHVIEQELFSMFSTGEKAEHVLHNKLMATWYILVGHVARDVKEFQFALRAFDRASTLQPQNVQVRNNIEVCEKLILTELAEVKNTEKPPERPECTINMSLKSDDDSKVTASLIGDGVSSSGDFPSAGEKAKPKAATEDVSLNPLGHSTEKQTLNPSAFPAEPTSDGVEESSVSVAPQLTQTMTQASLQNLIDKLTKTPIVDLDLD